MWQFEEAACGFVLRCYMGIKQQETVFQKE